MEIEQQTKPIEDFYNKSLGIIKDLYASIDDFALSSYFFLLKGIQMEYGIFKNKNMEYAIEFYKQGGILSNSSCYFKLYTIYSDPANKEKLYIIGDQHLHAIYYLLKAYSYYDETNPTFYFQHSEEFFTAMRSVTASEVKAYLEKYQNELVLSAHELEYLVINLSFLSDTAESDVKLINYSTLLLEFYKKTFHEECLHKIISIAIKIKQLGYVFEGMIKPNNIVQIGTNTKIFALLHKFMWENYDNPQFQNIFAYYMENKETFARKLKMGGFYHFYSQVKFIDVKTEDLFSETSTKHIHKVIKYLYKSAQCGNLVSITPLFYLNILINKHQSSELFSTPDASAANEQKFLSIFEILANTRLDNNQQTSNELKIVYSLFFKNGIKVKKNYKRCLEILESIKLLNITDNDTDNNDNDSDNGIGICDSIILNYYKHKCYLKLSLEEESRTYAGLCVQTYNSKKFFFKTPGYLHSMYLMVKLMLRYFQNESTALGILDEIKEATSRSVYSLGISSPLKIVDKIFYEKAFKFISDRVNIPKLRNSITSKNSSDDPSMKCPICQSNEKNIIAVPCGHKFICNDCFPRLNFSEAYICSTCNKKIECAIKKIFY